jgi:signal transduction histidine kinase
VTGSTWATSTDAVDHVILTAYREFILRLAPDLTAGPADLLTAQAQRILQATHAQLGHTPPEIGPVPGSSPDTRRRTDTVGTQRARSGVHPSTSLEAASALFRVALPRLIAFYEADEPAENAPERVALALHTAITDRLVAASVSYLDVVMDRLNSGHLVERRRISRDLHDRTSHGIGAALQGVDLALHQIGNGTVPDVRRLAITRRTLLETLNDVRAMSGLLRDAVGDRTLVEALHEYVKANVPFTLQVGLRETPGATEDLQRLIAEESYLVLREAVRNAVLHATDATRVDIEVHREEDWLVASVVDDGPGFDPDEAGGRRTVGLASMRERAEAIGGTVTIETPDPGGVRVVLRVPMPGRPMPAQR